MTYLASTQQEVTAVIPSPGTVVSLGDANQTYTADQMFSLMIRRTITAARTDTTATAAALVAALKGVVVGVAFYLDIVRTDAAAFNLTIAGGTGVTVTGTATIAASTARSFLVVYTNVTPGAEAVTLFSLGAATP